MFEFGTIEEAIFAFIVIRNKNRRSVKFHDIERGWQSN